MLLNIAFQDFYLDLTEDNRKITPRDYLELALRPQGGAKDVSAKNEVSFWKDILNNVHIWRLLFPAINLDANFPT